mgnify:CR=1 FL=1
MRKKIIVSVFVTLLVLVLIGCSGVTPVILDIGQEEKVKEVVINYWLALSNRQYELAKSYCILNGNAYQSAEEYQNVPFFSFSTTTFEPYFNYIETNGNNAKSNINITIKVTVCFEDICSSESEILNNLSMYLSKINGKWKLK